MEDHTFVESLINTITMFLCLYAANWADYKDGINDFTLAMHANSGVIKNC